MASERFVSSTADIRVDIVLILRLFFTVESACTTPHGIFKHDIKRQLLTDLQ